MQEWGVAPGTVLRMKRLITLLAALAALGLAACGGDDEADTVQAPPATEQAETRQLGKAEFAQFADSICAEGNAAIAALPEVGNPTEFSRQAAQKADIYEDVEQQISELGPPEEDADQFDAYQAAMQDAIAAFRDQASSASGADDSAVEAGGQSALTALERARIAAEAYGFKACGTQSSTTVTGAPSAPSNGGATAGGGSGGSGGAEEKPEKKKSGGNDAPTGGVGAP